MRQLSRIRSLVFLLPLALLCGTAQAVTLTDDRGKELTLEQPAARIVSLAPNLTELLFEAGAGDRLIGAVAYSDFPDAARRVPRIGEASRLNIEEILTLKPDLVVAWKTGNNREDYEKLERLGLKVYVLEPDRIARIPNIIEDLGRLTGTGDVADRAADAFRVRYADLQRRYAGRTPVTVFYQIWERPLMTINGTHFISDVLRQCGGKNVFDSLPLLAPAVDLEAVIATDPQAILINASAGDPDNWRRWPTVTAARLGNIFIIHDDLISRPTSRLLDGMEQLCDILNTARIRLSNDPRQ
ncbi:MAG: cobalamin-binding protein [Gammaproteobacteria bacterium]